MEVFERYQSGVLRIYNRNGIRFQFEFGKWSADNQTLEYSNEISAPFTTNRGIECTCVLESDKDIDEENICACRYNSFLTLKNIDFNDLLRQTVAFINQYSRCIECSKLMLISQRNELWCPNCTVQKMVDRGTPSLGLCCICTETMYPRNSRKLSCNHTFHKLCLRRLDSRICPLCREPF